MADNERMELMAKDDIELMEMIHLPLQSEQGAERGRDGAVFAHKTLSRTKLVLTKPC